MAQRVSMAQRATCEHECEGATGPEPTENPAD